MMKTSPLKHRHVILDALRGFALLGICMANFPEFSLYTFQPSDVVENMPSAPVDKITHWLLLFFVDGKFYTIFSLLFGIGFSIILDNARERGISGNHMFMRRMFGLAVIGFLHLMLLWSGDILLLYALMGMLLPVFMRLPDRHLLICAGTLLVLPVIWDTVAYMMQIDPALPAYNAWWQWAGVYGITEENFGTWLRDADSYTAVLQFLVQGAHERLWEFIDSSRYFKVLGLFLLGAYIGRHKVYAKLDMYRKQLRRIAVLGCTIGIPLSVVYAFAGTGILPLINPVKSLIYLVSVYPMGIAYCAIITLLFMNHPGAKVWKIPAYPGRMALSNYVGQSIFGIVLFYGVGFGFGTSLGLCATVATAICVYITQVMISALWLRYFHYGPLEWLWRMWNYGKYLKIKR